MNRTRGSLVSPVFPKPEKKNKAELDYVYQGVRGRTINVSAFIAFLYPLTLSHLIKTFLYTLTQLSGLLLTLLG